MTGLSPGEIQSIKALAACDAASLQTGIDGTAKKLLDAQMVAILRGYHRENTMNLQGDWTARFEKAGITQDDGKAAIACARRLGTDIS